jgi:hypothetical protein
MNRLLALAAACLLAAPLFGDTLPEKSDRIVDYRISARLVAETKQLDAHERITWRNPSTEPVPDLWFHLYLNAFKNSKSTFFRESGGQLRGDEFTDGKWGFSQIRSMRLADGTDLTRAIRYMHPDDDNADDQTVIRVALPEPVPAGGSVTLDVSFLAQLPQVFARTGYRHDYFLVGQWFPKLGVYEPAGMRGRKEGGWNCHQFHSTTEFYADYGHFLVELTLPARYIVGATGVRTGRVENKDGTVTYTYEQGDVHDFAWTASPEFVEVKRPFRAAEQVSPAEYRKTAELLGRSLDDVRLTDVDVTVLVQPGHMPQAERYVSSAMAAIKYFGLWYGRYPYKTLTVVDPGPGAGGSGGMEYPTLITGGTSFLFNRAPLDKVRGTEMVTIHEFGHQFWYALVGNNEFEEAWLDEGINSYSTGRVTQLVYGKPATLVDLPGFKFGEIDMIRMQNGPNLKFNAVLNLAWKYTPRDLYAFYSYTKPEILLFTLENYLGEQTMARIMRTFQERWRFRHPSSDDFFAVANEVAGRDLSWYFNQVVRDTDVLDYDLGEVSSEQVPVHFGVFEQNGKTVTVSRKDAQKEAEKADKETKRPFETRVVVRRRGEVVFPVDVELKFEGRPAERVSWDGRDRTITYKFIRPEKLEWVNVDPDRKVVLDVDWLNNGRRMNADQRVSTHWSAKYLFWIQNLIALIGM